MSTTSIFFNQSFDKKKLKTFIYWVLKTFGEKEALTIVEELKNMGFSNATKAGLSIGLHDLKTPLNKKSLILRAQITMNKTDQEFQGAELTATERSQRIIDTWHRTSEDLKKEVVDYFSMYDQLNSVYMMASSGARGNFSQVRQLIGMRGLMADPQGQIISFPIRSNLREGLTLTEYFISCSGARKGLVDTALRTADTGYLTRRLVDISHHIVVKKVTCYTSRGIGLKALRTSQKVLLSLKDRLIGRVLGENIYDTQALLVELQKQKDIHKNQSQQTKNFISEKTKAFIDINQASINTQKKAEFSYHKQSLWNDNDLKSKFINGVNECIPENKILLAKKNQEISPDLAFKISQLKANLAFFNTHEDGGGKKEIKIDGKSIPKEESLGLQALLALPGSGFHSASVLVRSPLTCAYTHEVCQLCYGWSMAQGSLVSLGEAVGVIAGQSIGEPGTQLTMRTFHTGGVFSGDLLQEIRAPHSGKIVFPQALQGLLIRTSQGKIAFLIKVAGELILDSGNAADPAEIKNFKLKNSKLLNQKTRQVTKLLLEPSTILFVRQGEKVKNNQILAELAITSEEGNQPIKSRQTLFSEIPGRVIQWKSLLCRPFEGQHKQSLPMKKNDTSKKQSDTKASLLSVRPYGRTSAKLMHNSIVISNRDTLNKIQQNEEYGRKYIDSPEFCSNSYALKLKYDCEETWKYIDNFALKKVMNLKKYGFESVEPPKALKLGLLSVISTRIGASKSKNIVTKKRVSISKNIHIKRHFLFGSSPTYLPLLTRHFSLANTTKANLLIKKKYILDKSLQKTHFLKIFNKKDKIHQFQIQKIFKHTIKRKIEDYNTLLYTYKKLCFLYAKLRYFPFSSFRSVYSESSGNVITSLKIFNQSTTLLKLKNKLKKKIPRTSVKKNNEKNNLDTPRDLIPHLNTIAEDGDLVDENYNLM